MAGERLARLEFLYRQSEGAIGRREWALASLAPTAILVVTTLIWLAIKPDAPRDLSRQGLFDLGVFAAFVYLPIFTFAVILAAVMQYFVSAKRFADRGEPPALAGLAPLSLLVAGAAHWYQPRSEGYAPAWVPILFDVVAAAAVLWSVWDLGFGASRSESANRKAPNAL